MIRISILYVLLVMQVCVTHAQTVQQRLDSLFQSLDKDGELSGAFLVVDSGKIVYEHYTGFENPAKTEKITSHSRFELASVSKQFTAMAIMQLEQLGKLSYEDDITRYFPQLKFKNVRIKNLLRHTAGIPEFLGWDPKWIDTKKINTNQDILKVIEAKIDSTAFKPGDQYAYSNTNYVLLSLIVEKVSGQPFADYMHQHIFKPAGMKSTSVFCARSHKADLKNYAKGMAYDAKTKSFKLVDNMAGFGYVSYFDSITGPYGISSTAQDLFKWNQAIQNNVLLKRDNFLKAISVDTLNSGKPIKMGGLYYGFGWLFTDSTDNANKMHFHTGGYPGYKSILVRDFKNQRYFIALLNKWNTIDVYPLTTGVNACFQHKNVPKIEREPLNGATTLMDFQIKQLLGTYEFAQQPQLKFKITADEQGNLFAQLSGQSTVQVYPKNDLELFYTVVQAELKFSKDNDRVTALTLYQNGQKLKFNKVK
ncbi:serine hydrolase domain-containing protein [Sphingobacterium thalpophilum]|uniref:serine hydrolase domain-containing protein n=1 Tax=Sphingobacterium thalpophilum TaxID=259 RepID=UPI002D79A4B9|nr:serine hydrolase domain-containing protein [Sphingobacterium thalpophilum]